MPIAEQIQLDADADTAPMLHPFSSISSSTTDGTGIIERGEGVRLWDAAGNELLDAAAGLWCVNVGYGRDEIINAMTEQAKKLCFYHSFNGMGNVPSISLADRILSLAPDGFKKVFFGNSGSDANDTSVKLIWFANNLKGKPEKKKIISRMRAYHGVTGVASSLSGLANVHENFDLPGERFLHVSAPDMYRSPERDAKSYAEELDALIRREGAHTIAAFWAEPVMGTGGVLVPPPNYYSAIKEVLDAHDVLLVFDEVISGFGRIGNWFGAQHYNVTPDIIVAAKGLTSLYAPLSAVLMGEKLWDVLGDEDHAEKVFNHGFTSTAHPIGAAAAHANLDIIEEEGLVDRARASGEYFTQKLSSAIADHSMVGDIRSTGLMVGIELVKDRESKVSFDPNQKVAARLRQLAYEEGVLIRALSRDVIAFSPAFIIENEDIDLIIERFVTSFEKMKACL